MNRSVKLGNDDQKIEENRTVFLAATIVAGVCWRASGGEECETLIRLTDAALSDGFLIGYKC